MLVFGRTFARGREVNQKEPFTILSLKVLKVVLKLLLQVPGIRLVLNG